jgi:hypothetical protein
MTRHATHPGEHLAEQLEAHIVECFHCLANCLAT